jgi:hypothetical protein
LWGIRKVEKEGDGREILFGMFLSSVRVFGVIECFCQGESLFVILDVVSVGFAKDSEARSFV